MFDKLLEMGFSADPLGPPSCKGVYVVTSTPWPFNDVCHILYVGRSNNISTRVASKYHPYKRLFASVRGGVSLWCKPCEDAERVEIEAIKALRPKYNVQHNGEEIY